MQWDWDTHSDTLSQAKLAWETKLPTVLHPGTCLMGNWFFPVSVLFLFASISVARFPHVDFLFMLYFWLSLEKNDWSCYHPSANQNKTMKAKAVTRIIWLTTFKKIITHYTLITLQTPYDSVLVLFFAIIVP